MTAYVIAILRPTLPVHADVLEYIERVQSTFEPYGGCFLSHGKPGEWVEGERLGDLVVVEFPDLAHAHDFVVRGCVMANVLFIVSGATYWVLKDGSRYATGYWAEEFANPYKAITDAGHEVVVATPGGVTPNVDMMSLRPAMAGGEQGALELEADVPRRLSGNRLACITHWVTEGVTKQHNTPCCTG